jgi:uncharacterized damage-inducible protein DinB
VEEHAIQPGDDVFTASHNSALDDEASITRRRDKAREPRRLGGSDTLSECGDGVVSPTLVVVAVRIGGVASRRLGVSFGDEPPKRPIQGPGLETKRPVGPSFSFLDDRVPMPLAMRESEQDLEFDGPERRHTATTCAAHIVFQAGATANQLFFTLHHRFKPTGELFYMASYGAKEIAAAFRTVRGNTIQTAEEIPEDKYDFVPAPGVRSVSELLRHIAVLNQIHYDFHRDKRVSTLQGYDFGAIMGRMHAEAGKPRTKAEIVQLLKDEGEKFAKWVESLTPEFLDETYTDTMGQNPRTRFEHILSAKEHEMHHRGQLMLIQRMLGVTPHLTRQMQERIAARAAAAANASAR